MHRMILTEYRVDVVICLPRHIEYDDSYLLEISHISILQRKVNIPLVHEFMAELPKSRGTFVHLSLFRF